VGEVGKSRLCHCKELRSSGLGAIDPPRGIAADDRKRLLLDRDRLAEALLLSVEVEVEVEEEEEALDDGVV